MYVLGAMLLWGFWGFFPKLATAKLDFLAATVWNWFGTILVALPCLYMLRGRIESGSGSWIFAVLTGACGMVGALLYFKAMALSGSHTSTVIVLSALYPVISVFLSFLFLRERLNAGQFFGIALCILGAVVLAYFSRPAVA